LSAWASAFVVTLAGLIGWQGVLLWVIGDTGTINLGDGLVQRLAGTFFDFPAAVGLAALFIAYLGWAGSSARRRRLHAGLTAERMSVLWLRIGGIAVVVTAAVLILAQDRGLPLSMVLLVALIVVMDYIARRTRFGRMVYAVGGNAEAARRAGIPVLRVRTAVFVLAGLLLNAIAAAVIGGTSLFGGRGTVWAALLGILVIQSISNGMDLLNFTPAFKQMITGGVLLTAVTIDAVVRRR
jgi:D-xylose transport system permease protein